MNKMSVVNKILGIAPIRFSAPYLDKVSDNMKLRCIFIFYSDQDNIRAIQFNCDVWVLWVPHRQNTN